MTPEERRLVYRCLFSLALLTVAFGLLIGGALPAAWSGEHITALIHMAIAFCLAEASKAIPTAPEKQ